jgi:ribosomal protein L33
LDGKIVVIKMINEIDLEAYYLAQATHFVGEAELLKYNAVAYCEDKVDKYFWESLFNNINPNHKFLFKFYSQSKNENQTTGKNQCLKFVPSCRNKFVICIDSDYDNLLRNNPYQANPFIFETYTYSIENHLCYAEHLNSVIAKHTQENLENYFTEVFFNSISSILFEILVYSVLSEQSQDLNEKYIYRHEFDDFFNFDTTNDIDLNTIRETIENKIQKKLQALENKYSAKHISNTKTNLNQLGISSANAFRYIKGHAIFDKCVLKIVKEIANKLSTEKFKSKSNKQEYVAHREQNKIEEIIFEISHSSGYSEIERILSDYKSYLNTV